jgi:S-adenosylmethionine:tRNA-ribosyltransferase-isomerase (queuine synthetase)
MQKNNFLLFLGLLLSSWLSIQTTYAKEEGSVAAPTAGLHFSKEVFDNQSNSIQDYRTIKG